MNRFLPAFFALVALSVVGCAQPVGSDALASNDGVGPVVDDFDPSFDEVVDSFGESVLRPDTNSAFNSVELGGPLAQNDAEESHVQEAGQAAEMVDSMLTGSGPLAQNDDAKESDPQQAGQAAEMVDSMLTGPGALG